MRVRAKKTAWIFAMAILLATLVLIVNSRAQLNDEVIVGGADSVFVKSDNLKSPLDDYTEIGKGVDGLEYPNIDINDWQYVLINGENPDASYEPNVAEIGETGIFFANDAMANLKSLLSAAKDAGFTPYVSCGYRSYSSQQFVFTTKANQLTVDGTYTYTEAVEVAKKTVAYPGTSDHQTGLAVDIMDKEYAEYDFSKMDKAFFNWLDENCAEYGFIKRYPSNKADITGWDEPWHYRYVGREAALFIMENGLSYEEFVTHYR